MASVGTLNLCVFAFYLCVFAFYRARETNNPGCQAVSRGEQRFCSHQPPYCFEPELGQQPFYVCLAARSARIESQSPPSQLTTSCADIESPAGADAMPSRRVDDARDVFIVELSLALGVGAAFGLGDVQS
ncbi:hypothetical protein L1887_52173 [Cichorium endivia]|nr:hypothetical protein L1887_52173 [Cichorium endivia]